MEEFTSLLLGSMLYIELSYPTFYRGEQIRQERRVSSRFDLRFCWRRMSNLLSVRLRAAVRYFGPWNFERTVLDCLALGTLISQSTPSVGRMESEAIPSSHRASTQRKHPKKTKQKTQKTHQHANVKNFFHHIVMARVSSQQGHKWIKNAVEGYKYILLT